MGAVRVQGLGSTYLRAGWAGRYLGIWVVLTSGLGWAGGHCAGDTYLRAGQVLTGWYLPPGWAVSDWVGGRVFGRYSPPGWVGRHCAGGTYIWAGWAGWVLLTSGLGRCWVGGRAEGCLGSTHCRAGWVLCGREGVWAVLTSRLGSL